MKKKTIIIISICIAVAIGITILCICLFGGKLNKHIKYIDKSMQQVKSIDTTLSVTDTEILVYQYIKEVDLMEDNSAVITTNNRTLGSSYELGNSIHTEKQENINRNDLFKMCLEKKYFSDYLIEDGVLTFDVSKENISKVFNTENFEITNDATFTFTFKINNWYQ